MVSEKGSRGEYGRPATQRRCLDVYHAACAKSLDLRSAGLADLPSAGLKSYRPALPVGRGVLALGENIPYA